MFNLVRQDESWRDLPYCLIYSIISLDKWKSGDTNLEADAIEQISNYIQPTLETLWIMKGYLQSGSDWGRCLVHPRKLSLPLTISTLHRSYSPIVPKVICHSSTHTMGH